MTNRIALVIALILIGLILADLFVFEWGLLLFIARKASNLSEWLAFWR